MKAIILSSGRADKSLTQLFGDIPTGLIPLNGKPGIFFIINRLIELGVNEVFITIGYQREKLMRLISNTYDKKLRLNFIETDPTKRAGNSLLKALLAVDSDEVLVNLGDTLMSPNDIENLVQTGRNSSSDCTVAVSKNFYHADLWCSAQIQDSEVVEMFDKPPKMKGANLHVLCGLYFLKNVKRISQMTEHLKNPEISDILRHAGGIEAHNVDDWLDFGHIHTLQRAKKNLLESRVFNELSFNDFYGTITKRSENTAKLIDEIKWQINLPKGIQILTPRVVEYSLDKQEPFVTMEYYSYQTVSELWLYSSYDKDVFIEMIDKLFELLLEIKNTDKGNVTIQDFESMYVEKTLSRFKILEQSPGFENLLLQPRLTINGVDYHNWSVISEQVLDLTSTLWKHEDTGLIHGDYCFSNILYDISSGIVRLLDPRGRWGSSKYGDVKYDLAKMRHSVSGGYDFIVNDLFDVKVVDNTLNYTLFGLDEKTPVIEYFDNKLRENFNLSQIQLIEGLLFLSMIPYHSNNLKRQYVMYCKALELLNGVVEI